MVEGAACSRRHGVRRSPQHWGAGGRTPLPSRSHDHLPAAGDDQVLPGGAAELDLDAGHEVDRGDACEDDGGGAADGIDALDRGPEGEHRGGAAPSAGNQDLEDGRAGETKRGQGDFGAERLGDDVDTLSVVRNAANAAAQGEGMSVIGRHR